jgi:RHH-type proline utilization regulon transcriptional repressor/proline dehydrogenase/delta 1-pyrroline-5-carboxylate dehydrogenase
MLSANDPADRPIDRFVWRGEPHRLTAARAAINDLWLADEDACVERLAGVARLDPAATARVSRAAADLVARTRAARVTGAGVDALMREYDLSSHEGMVLMCLAEALLRIPDAETADRLIADKLVAGDWDEHLGQSRSLFVNLSTWGLLLTGRFVQLDPAFAAAPVALWKKLLGRIGEPMVRAALRQAMGLIAQQFVMGRTIEAALDRARAAEALGYRHSYDMLGEAALTDADARRHRETYAAAIDAIGRAGAGSDPAARAGISVKLSALHPRYEYAQRERVLRELAPALCALAQRASAAGIGCTIDAEESERLDLSLEVFETVYRSGEFAGYDGLGLAVQAYQKRAIGVVDWVVGLAAQGGRRIPVRLVKGAYWDSEIKRGQERGLPGYPVFTRKCNTDVSYLACARRLLAAGARIYPMFATHNAHTLASVVEMAGARRDFEFQRLHGMGEELYAEVVGPDRLGIACRVYAPVGTHEDLLPYLVRRLLENGANTSFVNRIVDERVPIATIVADPIAAVEGLPRKASARIPLPRDLYGATRLNARGWNFNDPATLAQLGEAMGRAIARERIAAPVIDGQTRTGAATPVVDPADHRRVIGHVRQTDPDAVRIAVGSAAAAQPSWNRTPAAERAAVLRRAADRYEAEAAELMALCVREAGRTLPDAAGEVREAIDFLRYYAARTEADFGAARSLPGPAGESNELWLEGRGVFVCISPWNFPLAIFTGQIAAALAAGNAVLAKPAEQTPLVAARALECLHAAGVPAPVLQYIPGSGPAVGQAAVADPRIAGVAFTGSTATARAIERTLAARDGPIATLIAETGGQNAMLADSSALPEQVVLDAVASAFNSAGQRCSALRALFVQADIAERVLELLRGHMQQLRIGDPALIDTDIGPVIDRAAQRRLEAHRDWIKGQGRVVHELPVPGDCAHGTYVAPLAIEIPSIDRLRQEVFGPILHVVRWRADELDSVIAQINRTGYGLTLGIHSRIDTQVDHVWRRVRAGNVYVNRNMIGAVVGVQPFGGQGLSGTGPKAGGPYTLHRYATERTVTINTAAVGGNASLLAAEDVDAVRAEAQPGVRRGPGPG